MKQVIIVRQDLQLPKGKVAAQVAHASVTCYSKAGFLKRNKWMKTGMKKIVLKVKTVDELQDIKKRAKKKGLTTALIADAGHTVVEAGTITCLGIGPDEDALIDTVTGDLQML